ncbi:SMAD/FHA domain-containing protein [Radiomyces spectabilis]|uniref:SMAD/FHA domain-containing protein n=1 Tax=Radiomyces spectabilis TaxID=64574 RepID=UPI002221018E|nr:SMAD/FHA domain-containing protein [Radiomyces spectabilis]KAI8374475.1 SMAD/FHA domain-containing protein [Radiomyces spectabilis]
MPSSPSSRSHSRSRSRSRSPARSSRRDYRSSRRRSRSRSRSPPRRRYSRDRNNRRSEGGGDGRRRYQWGRPDEEEKEQEPKPEQKKQEPNFGLSGKLAAETNTYKGVELKYNEPPEAAKPTKKWRLYVFKGDEQIDLLHIHRQTAFLIGRDRIVVDLPVDHPSCSKQHAVIQFREVREGPNKERHVKPFIIDLESTNGTFLNGEQIPSTRYVELRVKDVLKFGQSTREYVLLHSEINES